MICPNLASIEKIIAERLRKLRVVCQILYGVLMSEKDVQTYQVGKDAVMVIAVPRAKREQKPIYVGTDMFKGTYRRNWEGDYHCTSSEVKAMLRDQTEDTMDMKILKDMQMDVLNMETVHAYRNRHMAYRREHVWEQLGDEDYLERIGAARVLYEDNRLHPTTAGLLMFGDEYKILYECPEYFLDFRELLDPTIRWTDRLQSASGKEQMLKGGISDPRNKALMKMFNMIGIGERAGSGVPDIYSVWKNQGWIEPQVIEEYSPDRTILKLSFVSAESETVIGKRDRKKETEKRDRKNEEAKGTDFKQNTAGYGI